MPPNPSGTIRVRFFARYAELVGRAEAAVAVPLPATGGDVVRSVREQLPGAGDIPERPLAAVNLRHAKLDASVRGGDEIGRASGRGRGEISVGAVSLKKKK